MAEVPRFDEYMRPVLAALARLGGSGSDNELYEAVVAEMGLSEEQLAVIHESDGGNQTEVAYRMAWARSWLKKAGYVTDSARGVWALTQAGREENFDERHVLETVRAAFITHRPPSGDGPSLVTAPEVIEDHTEPDAPAHWRSRIRQRLIGLSSDAFERLCQRVLREMGFVEVRVIGRTGDGGIAGRGILRLQRVVSFQVLFQCKKYRGTIGSKEIRDFRGAMVGRTDKGLFLTTGTFSRGARQEATRDGAPPIDLIDGERLTDLLKELSLGVQTTIIERVDVVESWFDGV